MEQADQTVVALMLTQYRMSKVEEIVTKNVFRAIWFVFIVYVSTNEAGVDEMAFRTRNTRFLVSVAELFALTVAGLVLFIVSTCITKVIRRQTNTVREMLVNLDRARMDYYVTELYKEEFRMGMSGFFATLARREEAIWFGAVLAILYLRGAVIFAS